MPFSVWVEKLQRGKYTSECNEWLGHSWLLPRDENDHRILKLEGLRETYCCWSTYSGIYLYKVPGGGSTASKGQVIVALWDSPVTPLLDTILLMSLGSPVTRLETLQPPIRSPGVHFHGLNPLSFLGDVVSSHPGISVYFVSTETKLWLAWHNLMRPKEPNEVIWCNGW